MSTSAPNQPRSRGRRRVAAESAQKRELGLRHNYIGGLYQASGQTFPGYLVFYDRAIKHFKQAADLLEDYLPNQNLGDTYRFKGQALGGSRAEAEFRRSLAEYEKAIDRLARVPEEQRWAVQRVILLSRATTQLLLGTPTLVEQARRVVRELDRVDYGTERDAIYLYNLAAWHGIDQARGSADSTSKRTGRQHLAYGLARAGDGRMWGFAGQDPDLAAIREGLHELVSELRMQLAKTPELPKLTGMAFTSLVEQVMERAGWR
jgi:tetratricopeptide (TPR) repeat protein